ncbi:MAG: HK97 family phage prohead protease [Planctomycetaceae bacterium]
MNVLRRYNRSSGVQIIDKDGKRQIAGYAAVWYDGTARTEFEMGSVNGARIVERMFPSGIDLEGWDTLALHHHRREFVLGRRSAGTLALTIDRTGLHYLIDPPDAQYARDLMLSIDRGDIIGSSFGMHPEDYNKKIKADRSQSGLILFNVDKPLRILDVGPTPEPAYKATTAELRSLIPQFDELEADSKPTNTPEQTRRLVNDLLADELLGVGD